MADLLVVDDDIDLGDVLALYLEMQGHDVRVARNGEEGLHLMRERLPELVLMDVEMPRMSGPDMAILMIIEDAGRELIPVILLSGVVGLDVIAKTVGTPYFRAKPYNVEDVMSLVNRALTERIAPKPEVSHAFFPALASESPER